jgi:CubicO group peptidase (beta-lactamase class C family)
MMIEHSTNKSTDYSTVIGDLRDSIHEQMAKYDIPGFAIALVEGRNLIWAEGFGYTDRTKTHPVTADTPFSLQSTGKTYTATGFLVAVSKGLIQLDDPLRKYYPTFKVNSRFGKEVDKITFRHLLSHWSGLCHEAPVGSNYDNRPCTFEEHVQSIADTWLKFPVGQRRSYSNLGMDLAGYVLQLVSGTSFIQYMADELLKPLGMTNSSYDQRYIMASYEYARGHTGKSEAPAQIIPMLACGSIFASARDMAKFVSFHLAGGIVDGKRLINKAILKEMYQIQFPVEKQVCGFGLGILIAPQFGATHLYHPGGGYGYQAVQSWIPEYNIGAVALTNQANHPNVQSQIRDAALRGMIAAKYGSVPEDQPLPFADWPAIRLKPDQLRRLEGYYRGGDSVVSVVSVKVKEGTLYLRETQALRPYGATEFTTADGVRVTFRLNEQGRPEEMQILDRWGYNRLPVDHTPTDDPGPDKESWRKLTGIYSVVEYGNTHFVAVTVKNGHLYVVGWMGEARLAEYTPTTFFTTDGEAVIFGDGTMTYGNAPLVREINPHRQAFELAETAPDDEKLRHYALSTLARAYLTLQDQARAIALLTLNVRLHPGSVRALQRLAKACLDVGDRTNAEKYYRQILEIEPENENALKMLEAVREG